MNPDNGNLDGNDISNLSAAFCSRIRGGELEGGVGGGVPAGGKRFLDFARNDRERPAETPVSLYIEGEV